MAVKSLRNLILCLLATVFLTSLAAAQYAPKTPVIKCPLVAMGPAMDGRIEPQEWLAAGQLSSFILLGGEGFPNLPTMVYVMHTPNALYIGAQMTDDRPGELVATVRDQDGNVYEDDSLEVFIDAEGARRSYAHLVVNPLGTRYDEIDHDVAENFEWNAVAAVNEKGWSVEIELPFDQGIPPNAGEVWGIAVCRSAVRANEMSTWGRHERGFNEPSAFGELIFSGVTPTVKLDDLGETLLGDNLALITLTNNCVGKMTVKVNVAVGGNDRRSHYYGAVKKELLPGTADQIFIPYKVRRCGPAMLTLSLTDDQGKTIWRSGAYPESLPPMSDALEAAMHSLANAWKQWAQIPAGDVRDILQDELNSLQKEWGYVDSQMKNASSMPLERLDMMYAEAEKLKARSDSLFERVSQVSNGEGQ